MTEVSPCCMQPSQRDRPYSIASTLNFIPNNKTLNPFPRLPHGKSSLSWPLNMHSSVVRVLTKEGIIECFLMGVASIHVTPRTDCLYRMVLVRALHLHITMHSLHHTSIIQELWYDTRELQYCFIFIYLLSSYLGAMGSIYLLCPTCHLRRLTVWGLIFLFFLLSRFC